MDTWLAVATHVRREHDTQRVRRYERRSGIRDEISVGRTGALDVTPAVVGQARPHLLVELDEVLRRKGGRIHETKRLGFVTGCSEHHATRDQCATGCNQWASHEGGS